MDRNRRPIRRAIGKPLEKSKDKRYIPGLDGLRAISVLAVIAYHLDAKWAQGGLLGVGIFFVLSGYLITDQIIMEWRTKGRLLIVDFWIRRARRLLPAMVTMLLFVACWLLILDAPRLQALHGDFLTSLLYVNNWYLIFREVSYFESFGPPSPIGHMWSLSIEEQFYVLWPIILILGIKLVLRRGRLMLWILIGAAISAMAMGLMYEPGTDPSRVYYGTDTRAFALLIGAAVAVIWPSWKLSGRITRPARSALDSIGGLLMVLLLGLMCVTNEYDDFLYRGGFVYLSILSAVVIAVLVHPASRVNGILGWRPLVWVGKRSYSLYLWHYPVIILTNPVTHTEKSSFTHILLQLLATAILAALSYTYIEEPFRRGNIRATLHWIRKRRIGLLAVLLPLFLTLVAWSDSLKEPSAEEVPTMSQELAPVAPAAASTNLSDEFGKHEDESLSKAEDGITAIGDSLLIGAAPELEQMLPGIVIDGKVGRQMSQAQRIVDDLQAQGQLGNRILLELGTNGPFRKAQLRSLLESLNHAKQIYIVTTRVPKDWQDTVNESIQDVAAEFGNTTVIDWYAASAGRQELFSPDGVHLTTEGIRFYASLLADRIKQDTHQ